MADERAYAHDAHCNIAHLAGPEPCPPMIRPPMIRTTKSEPGRFARYSCGCGFEAVGFDEQAMAKAFQTHSCSEEGDPWYVRLFSWELVIVVMVIGSILMDYWSRS